MLDGLDRELGAQLRGESLEGSLDREEVGGDRLVAPAWTADRPDSEGADPVRLERGRRPLAGEPP